LPGVESGANLDAGAAPGASQRIVFDNTGLNDSGYWSECKGRFRIIGGGAQLAGTSRHSQDKGGRDYGTTADEKLASVYKLWFVHQFCHL
jgi:hypothetical protein